MQNECIHVAVCLSVVVVVVHRAAAGSQSPAAPEWDLDRLMAQWRSSADVEGEEQGISFF